MEHTAPPEVTKKELDDAQAVWTGFTKFAKIGVIVTCIFLVLLALTLL
tara:strand:+ start:106 stop:249 length:144 start_codon:yes stop_codon:yes gene_type:complete